MLGHPRCPGKDLYEMTDRKRYWLVPPDIYKALDAEFHFTYDPCPFPHVEGHNGVVGDWGEVNFINPPFRKDDILYKAGPTAFCRKAIEEQKKGRSSVLLLPTQSYMGILIDAGATFRNVGRVKWVETDSGEAMPNPGPVIAAILKGDSTNGR